MLLPHFDVICALLLNRRTATWNLFVNNNRSRSLAFISFAVLVSLKVKLTAVLDMKIILGFERSSTATLEPASW